MTTHEHAAADLIVSLCTVCGARLVPHPFKNAYWLVYEEDLWPALEIDRLVEEDDCDRIEREALALRKGFGIK